jgi:hypothetical protein
MTSLPSIRLYHLQHKQNCVIRFDPNLVFPVVPVSSCGRRPHYHQPATRARAVNV